MGKGAFQSGVIREIDDKTTAKSSYDSPMERGGNHDLSHLVRRCSCFQRKIETSTPYSTITIDEIRYSTVQLMNSV